MGVKSFLRESIMQVIRRPLYLLLMISAPVFSFLLTRLAEKPNILRDVPAAVIDLCRDDLSREVLEDLGSDSLLKTVSPPGETNPAPYLSDLLYGRIEAVFVIDEDFSEKIKAGDFKGCLHAYYGENQVSAGLLTETVTASVMNICIRERGIRLLQQAYSDAEIPFTVQEDARLYFDGLESAEYPIEFISLDGGSSDIPAFRTVVIRSLRGFMLSLLLFFSCAFLSRQQEDGIFLRLRGLGRSPEAYQSVILLTSAAGIFLSSCIGSSLAAPEAIGGLSVSTDLLLLLSASALFMICLKLIKTRRVFLLLYPLLPGVLITGILIVES